jgi:hypothetical protein
MRSRNAATALVRRTHQAPEPAKTPAVTNADPAESLPVTRKPANKAAKDRMVMGFVSVRARIER